MNTLPHHQATFSAKLGLGMAAVGEVRRWQEHMAGFAAGIHVDAQHGGVGAPLSGAERRGSSSLRPGKGTIPPSRPSVAGEGTGG